MKLKQIAYFLLLLVVIFFSSGVFFEKNSAIPSYCINLLVGISIIYFFKTLVNFKKEILFYKVWTFFLVVNIVGFFFTENIDAEFGVAMFKNILIVFFPFYPIYYFSKRQIVDNKMLIFFLLAIIPVVILRFFNERFEILLESDSSTVVNNVAYVFVALIPYVFLLINKKLFSIITLSLLFFFIVLGSKRGAMITACLGTLSYLYLLYKTIERKNKIKGFLFFTMGIVILILGVNMFLLNNDDLVSRFQSIASDGGSGRDLIYKDLWEAWANSESLVNTLFGFGFASSLSLNRMGLFAHNDWLEMLTSFGLFGVILYFLLFYSLFTCSSKLKKEPKYVLRTIIIMLLVVSSISMFYTIFDNVLYVIFIAYIFGNPNMKKSIL